MTLPATAQQGLPAGDLILLGHSDGVFVFTDGTSAVRISRDGLVAISRLPTR